MVINRLQLAKGGNEYLCNLKEARATNIEFVDFETHAKSMGANAETVSSFAPFKAAGKPPPCFAALTESWRHGNRS